jgi:copper transport protein
VALLALATAPSAFAHAILVQSVPDNAAVVQASPAQVLLRFSESVETAFGAVRVFDEDTQRVDTGQILRPEGDEVAVRVRAGLKRGTYTVTWRAISADSHPVHGAFVFYVGKPGGNTAGVAAAVQGRGTPGEVEVLRDVIRGLGFGLLLLVVGGIVALVAILPPDAPGRRRLWLALSWTAALLVPLALAAIVLQGASAGGFGIGQALHGDVISTVLDTRFGKVWLGQAAAAAALAVIAQLVPRSRAAWAACLGLAAWLAVTPGAAGHAQASGALAFAADAVHVTAAAVWLGGLAAVIAVVAGAGEQRWPVAARVVPRFSAVALGSVVALVTAGSVSGYLQVRSWSGLWETRYGVLLLVKVGLVLVILALAAVNRLRAVPRLRAEAGDGRAHRRFLAAAGLELGLAAVVIGVTAVLVATPPARVSASTRGPYAVTTGIGPLELNLVIDPARTGSNAVHVYLLLRNGQPAPAAEVTVKASLPSAGIGPLTWAGRIAGPGHFVFPGATLPLAGRWSLRIEARRGEFEELTSIVSVPIRKGA